MHLLTLVVLSTFENAAFFDTKILIFNRDFRPKYTLLNVRFCMIIKRKVPSSLSIGRKLRMRTCGMAGGSAPYNPRSPEYLGLSPLRVNEQAWRNKVLVPIQAWINISAKISKLVYFFPTLLSKTTETVFSILFNFIFLIVIVIYITHEKGHTVRIRSRK